jgi:hypothetical protein
MCEYSKEHILSNKNCESCNNILVTHISLFKLNLCIVHKNEYHYNYLIQKKEQEKKIKIENKLAKIKEKQSVIKQKQSVIKEKQSVIKQKQSVIKENIPKCLQITKKGIQCSFKAIKDGLCKKHGLK